jgi:Flp pilus assembly protein TadG
VRRRRTQRGSVLIEFTLVGVMFMFIWLGVVQMSIGMWRYHALQYAVKLAGSYVAVHGSTCSQEPNNCAIQIKNAAQVLKNAAAGIDPTTVNMKFTILAADRTTEVSHISCELDTCLSDTTGWPPTGNNSPGQDFSIHADYFFRSGISIVVPGSGTVQFGSFHLPGYTHQVILF